MGFLSFFLLGRVGSHGWAGSGTAKPLTSPSCPDSAPAYPWRELWRGGEGVFFLSCCGCETLIFNGTDLRRWKRWSRGQTHGSCEEDGPGHVRRRRTGERSQNGGRRRAGWRRLLRNRRQEIRPDSPSTHAHPWLPSRVWGNGRSGVDTAAASTGRKVFSFLPNVDGNGSQQLRLPCCCSAAAHTHSCRCLSAQSCGLRHAPKKIWSGLVSAYLFEQISVLFLIYVILKCFLFY